MTASFCALNPAIMDRIASSIVPSPRVGTGVSIRPNPSATVIHAYICVGVSDRIDLNALVAAFAMMYDSRRSRSLSCNSIRNVWTESGFLLAV